MLSIKVFRLSFCLFQFNQNIETLCFCIEAKQPKQTSDSVKTSFSSSFFESKDTLLDQLIKRLVRANLHTESKS